MTKPLKHLYLVDGSGFIFRAFHALPPLTRPDGTPVNAVYGFTNMLMKLLLETDVDHLAVVFDSARRNYRHDIYPAYKANRPEPPEELIPQFGLIREACYAFNVPSVELEGYEADDLIATYTRLAGEKCARVTIVSSDKDLMQLVRGGVDMLEPLKNKPIGPEEVLEKFGVTPDKVRDVQSLAGDSTDNVPGVPGIGIKTAAELITQYGSLEGLLSNLKDIKQPKRREKLEENMENARVSYKLVGLEDHAPVQVTLDDFERKTPDGARLKAFLEKQAFRAILSRLDKLENLDGFTGNGDRTPPPSLEEKTSYTLVQTLDDLKKWIDEIRFRGIVAVDTETTSLDAMRAEIVGVSLCLEPFKACYIPLAHKSIEGKDLFGEPVTSLSHLKQIPLKGALALLKEVLEDPSILKIGQNIKYDLHIFENEGIKLVSYDDTMVMSYDLDGSKNGHGMDELADLHLGHTTIKYQDVAGSGKTQKSFAEVSLEHARDYAAEDADITFRLHRIFKSRLLREKQMTIYEALDRPMVGVLQRMEREGVLVDVQKLKDLSRDFEKRLKVIEEDVFRLVGHNFNIGSPKQLGQVLFEEMGFEGAKKSPKTGDYVTSADILEDLASQGHVLPQRVLDWRALAKLKSTYTDTLAAQIDPKTGRVHTDYGMTLTSTGRLNSSNPNLQNIPIRTEEGRKIREAFIAKPDHMLLSLDYSQIELRLFAHMAKIETLKQAFREGKDIHKATASEVFGISIDKVDPEHRRRAKAINFGIIYGISPFGLARQLKIDKTTAGEYIDLYYQRYPGIRPFMEEMKSKARKQGFVETLFGRRIYISDINDKNPAKRGFAERQAINAPLQGTSADIIKRAMVQVEPCLKAENLGAKMLLQVHDELVFEVPEREVERTVQALKPLMERAIRLDVPLIVDAGFGKNWSNTGK